MKSRIKMDLQLFSEELGAESGVNEVPAAEVQMESEVTPSESGANTEVAAEPEKLNNFEKAFAKRLAAEREKWQSEVSEKFNGYEDYKYLADYLQETNGMDVLTLKETIELERLQARAEREQVPTEVLKRLDYLEAKAAKGDELEQQIQESQRVQTYFDSLGKFVEGKGVSSEQLNQFMIENQLAYDPENMERSFNLAYKAMKADEIEQKFNVAKEEGIKEYLASKQAPRVEGSGTPGVVQEDTSKLGWNDLRARALARIQASNQST